MYARFVVSVEGDGEEVLVCGETDNEPPAARKGTRNW